MKVIKFFLGFLPIIVFFAIQTVAVMPVVVLEMVRGDGADMESMMSGNGMMIAMVISELAAVVILGFWYWFQFVRKSKRYNVLRCVSKYSIPAFLLISVGCYFAVSGYMCVLGLALPKVMENYNQYMESTGLVSSGLGLVVAICMGPVAEELTLRGCTIHLFKESGCKYITVLLIQAAIFGIMHMQPVQVTYTFVVGLLLGIMSMYYDSILISIVGHLVFNFSGTIVSDLLGDYLNVPAVIILGVLGVMAIVCGIILMRKDPKAKANVVLWGKEREEIRQRLAEKDKKFFGEA